MTAPSELDTGNYEVIRARLAALGDTLRKQAESLNAARKETFGGTELTVVGNERVRTQNNCVPRDIVNVGGHLLFGYNVFLGLKTETKLEDVLSLQEFNRDDDGAFKLHEVPLETLPGLTEGGFPGEFRELYQYYKEAKLAGLRSLDSKLLAVFQTGARTTDVRVFRWALDLKLNPTYIDSRGERDHVFPPTHDFEWTPTGREDHVQGRHPHVAILDEVFVETVGGDLTIKVEDNTEDGLGIYRELVDDANQALDDARIDYATVGVLILLRVLPFREEARRYFVFNRRTQEVVRIDAIEQSCVQLPEDHGIIFPGGYYLQSGDYKVFDGTDAADLEFERAIRSPNGEDVLYVFHHQAEGSYALFPYNLIRKEVQNPIHCHGWTLFDDGTMIVFRSLSSEPTRVHPMQIWATPFTSDEFAAQAPTGDTFLGKVGNADLVRGISDALSVVRLINEQTPSRRIYESLVGTTVRVQDAYYWLGNDEVGDLASTLASVRENAELIIDEFEKVVALSSQATSALDAAAEAKLVLERDLRPENWRSVEPYMQALTSLRTQRGHLITLKEMRYIDLERVEALEAELVEHFERVSKAAVDFLLRDEALQPISAKLDELLAKIEALVKTSELPPLAEELEATSDGLNVLTEIMGTLEVDDPTKRTAVLEGISEVFGHLNAVRATLNSKKNELLELEGKAEFSAQFRLFSQSVSNALALCDTPEACDEQLSRLMLQLEELEGRFSEFDAFLGELTEKRDEVYEAFDSKRQTLVDARQRRAKNLWNAAERILQSVQRRSRTFESADQLNTYFASDSMVMKLRQLAKQLLGLGDSVKSDEIEARVKAARQDAMRGLRDRLDLYEDGADVVKLGKHKFNVNTRALELTLVPGDEGMSLHLTGTDFHELVDDEAFLTTRPFWEQQLVSESPQVYRGEFLAACMLADAEQGQAGLSLELLQEQAREEQGLLATVRRYANDRYDEGYERGLHDADTAAILGGLIELRATAGLLRFAPDPRAWACLFWAHLTDEEARERWHRRGHSLGRLRSAIGTSQAGAALGRELALAIGGYQEAQGLVCSEADLDLAGAYLADELGAEQPRFVTSQEAQALVEAFRAQLTTLGQRSAFEEDQQALEGRVAERLGLARAWLETFLGTVHEDEQRRRAPVLLEAAVLLVTEGALEREVSAARLSADVPGLLGQHPRIDGRVLHLRLDEFLARLARFRQVQVPAYRRYREQVRELIERQRVRLRIEELQPRVLTSFVRNKLINEVYLHLVGDNLAKQMGAAGDTKRTDLMGLLLLISPPGYGKTTLMEYVSSRLGLAFVKVNGPSLGHAITSLDPSEADNATARQEVQKVNLALEMGNNVMLYLDDIQHTHPEFLQKFISLCDGQRRIEGVWKGRTRTYDLRGKKFCVVMAGNPYTEAGEKFQIPDMLANRADTYNLGEILDGKEDLFALSYVENAITSNQVLAPLAGRDQEDIYRVIRMAQGEEIPSSEFSHGYSGVELQEIAAVLQRLFRVRDVLLKVNAQYIASASMDDDYRTEPPFKLQGSYRNMNKVTEKVAAALNDDELERLIDDHYQSESQTLTTGAEQNLLKLAELRGTQTEAQRARWEEIKQSFARVKLMGGKDDDPVARISGPLSGLAEHLAGLRAAVSSFAGGAGAEPDPEVEAHERAEREALRSLLSKLDGALDKLAHPQLDLKPLQVDVRQQPLQVQVQQQPLRLDDALISSLTAGFQRLSQPQVQLQQAPLPIDQLAAVQADLVKQTLLPLVQQAAGQLRASQATSQRLGELLADYLEFEQARRVRLKPPSKRTQRLESESSAEPPE